MRRLCLFAVTMSSAFAVGVAAVAVAAVAVAAPASAAGRTSSTGSVTVPWVSCPTQLGNPGPAPAHLPATISVKIPTSLAGKVAVYSNSRGGMLLLAPKGWSCNATLGADGQGGVSVFPAAHRFLTNTAYPRTRSNAQAVVGHETSAASGPTLSQACPLFPTAQHLFHKDNPGLSRSACHTKPPARESTHALSALVVAFTDPPHVLGDGYPSGGPYAAQGVMTFDPQSANGSWLETCTLPAGDAAICRASTTAFVSEYGSL